MEREIFTFPLITNFDVLNMKPFKGTVLVAGATGRTGRCVVDRLNAHGIDYRLFVRSKEKAIEMFGPESADKLSIGAIENADEIEAALNACSAVISAIGAYVTDPGAARPSVIDRDGMKRLATIAKNLGLRKFVQVTSLAVTKPEHPMNKYDGVLNMKLQGENAIRSLYSDPGFSYTIIRPGGLLDGPPLQHDLQFDTGDRMSGTVDRGDVAETAVISLWHPKAHNLTFEIIRGQEQAQSSLEHFFDRL